LVKLGSSYKHGPWGFRETVARLASPCLLSAYCLLAFCESRTRRRGPSREHNFILGSGCWRRSLDQATNTIREGLERPLLDWLRLALFRRVLPFFSRVNISTPRPFQRAQLKLWICD
jgi:hypothetical protein